MTYWIDSVQSMLRPLKHCCNVNPSVLPETTDPDWEFDYIDISSVSLTDGVTNKERMRFSAAPSRARKPVRKGDILVSTVRTYLKAIAAVEQSDIPQVASTGFAVLRAIKGTDPRFLYRVVQSNPFVEQVKSQSTGISYPAINPSTLANIEIPLPDLATQRQIADFLDRETARIDLLIEKKQKLVALLGEKFAEEKRSLFYGDGERSSTNLKFPFLRRVNENWRVSKNARHFKIRMGETILSESVSETGRFPVYSATEQDVFFGYVDQTSAPLKLGDLVIPARGNSIGHVKFVTSDSTSTQTTIQLSCIDKSIRKEFAFCWMKSFKQYLFPFDRTAIPQITTEQVGRNPIPIADQDQQDAVSRAFAAFEEQEVYLLAPIRKSVDRLKEYRSALITAAVTGQIDLKNHLQSGATERALDAVEEVCE